MTFAGYETAADLVADYKKAERAAFPDTVPHTGGVSRRVRAEFDRLNELYVLLQQVGHRQAFGNQEEVA